MPDANKISRKQSWHARRRLPRKGKPNGSTALDTSVTRPELIKRNVNILKYRDNVSPSTVIDRDIKQFEFVTLTSQPTTTSTRESSKAVRKQAMNDYLRKQNRQATTGIVEVIESVHLEEPSRYKGKFKLDTWSHKTKTKTILARKAKLPPSGVEASTEEYSTTYTQFSTPGPLTLVHTRQPIHNDGPHVWIFSHITSSLDPFDTLAIKLGPMSEDLLVHYDTKYTLNSVAINAESNFFSFVKTDPALFHSILYLVALHRDMWYGSQDSPVCLYHGGEAFRIINERLKKGVVFDDVTIAAVAMLVNKENINGRYDLSKLHMRGLKQMVGTRNGPQNLSGVFRRIVTWSDICFSNVWNIQPSFPRLPSTLPTSPIPLSIPLNPEILKASHIFGSSSPIIPIIINNLRTLTSLLPPSQIPSLPTTSRMVASNLIYDTEYSLLELNPLSSSTFSSTFANCGFVFESLPLRIALHVYLYLSFRNVPATAELVLTMVERLKDSLGLLGILEWWKGEEERRNWLLWILWVGAVASRGEEKWWFLGELGRVCCEMGVWDREGLREKLRRCVWEEEWCGVVGDGVWEDVGLCMYGVSEDV